MAKIVQLLLVILLVLLVFACNPARITVFVFSSGLDFQ